MGIRGLYFIFTTKIMINYPFKQSRLLYIGMSERRTNSIGSRLISHLEGNGRNWGLINYNKVDQLNFTHINIEMLRRFWDKNIEDLESYFLLDFVDKYGVYPICNNKSGYQITENRPAISLKLEWSYFE